MFANILGCGAMGRQIASLFCLAGYRVHIWDCVPPDLVAVNRELHLARRFYRSAAEGTIRFEANLASLPDCVTVEAVVEDLDVKRDLYRDVRSRNRCAYYSNTSSYLPAEIGEDVKSLHFFNPVAGVKLVEYIDDDDLASIRPLIDFGQANAVQFVRVRQNRGYLGNFLLFHEIAAVFRLIEAYRYRVEDIGEAYKFLFGNRNIFQVVDRIGIDVCLTILQNLHEEDPGIYVPALFQEAVARGILGKKNKTSIIDVLTEAPRSRMAA